MGPLFLLKMLTSGSMGVLVVVLYALGYDDGALIFHGYGLAIAAGYLTGFVLFLVEGLCGVQDVVDNLLDEPFSEVTGPGIVLHCLLRAVLLSAIWPVYLMRAR